MGWSCLCLQMYAQVTPEFYYNAEISWLLFKEEQPTKGLLLERNEHDRYQ